MDAIFETQGWGWFKYIIQCGPLPGSKPNPKEVWPGNVRTKRMHAKKAKQQDEAEVETVKPEFMQEAFRALSVRRLLLVPVQPSHIYSLIKLCYTRTLDVVSRT